jgi:hypothetical protein
MDLYVQAGTLLVMASLFVLVAYFAAEAVSTGNKVTNKLTVDNVRYSRDSIVTSTTFNVDTKNFKQWVLSTMVQRDIYLDYPNATPPSSSMKQYQHMLVITVNSQLPGDRVITVDPKPNGTSGFTPNSIRVDLDNGTLLAYVDGFISQAQTLYDPTNVLPTNANIRVETFTETGSGKVIYVCYNQ